MTNCQSHRSEQSRNHLLHNILSYLQFLHLMSSSRCGISEFITFFLSSQEIKSPFSCLGQRVGIEMGHICLTEECEGEQESESKSEREREREILYTCKLPTKPFFQPHAPTFLQYLTDSLRISEIFFE